MKLFPKAILLLTLLIAGVTTYIRCTQEEIAYFAMGICTFWNSATMGTKPEYCKFMPNPNSPAGKCVSCEGDYTVGYCVDGLYWQSNPNGKQCGKDAGLFGGMTGCATADRCIGVGGVPIQTNRSGFITPDEIPLPPNVKAVTPANGSIIYPNTTVIVQTTKSLEGDSIQLSGPIGTFVGNSFTVKRKDQFNDQVTLQLDQNVPRGTHKALTIKGKDLDGQDLQINLNYSILANGQSPTISSTTCQPECLARWIFDSYAYQFTAQGGFPPYTWYMNGQIPPGATMSSDGVLSGPPTGNFLGRYYFVVTVVDSNNTVANFNASINSFDLGAACYFAGICW
ncbi:hypothetical protein M5D10_04140 [Leptospira santarosai]|uniref:Ig-like domain-containing protein n=1 Tax=Leptospira santarosai TaxID=28183 RepID=UPI0022A99EB0|nr:putative Ig domain-containing protein [Leptospira santarosai]UZN08172.1 hypothetical protein M5D10_04140 [Leptospira santarosai]